MDFATKAIEVREARLKKEARAGAAERKRAAAACKRHLESIMKRADTIWAGLDPLMDQKIASAYDNTAARTSGVWLRSGGLWASETSHFQ